MLKKILAWLLIISTTATIAIGGTLAYLTDRDSEANVFTVGDVKIDLEEDFEHGAELIPGVEIEKKPTITNVGPNDAWVWLEFAIPAALDNYVQGTEQGSNENVIHWNPKGATTEGYVTEDRVKAAIDAGFFGDMDTDKLTAEYINTNNMHWNVFNSLGEGKNAYQTKIEVDGKEVDYNVYVLLYNKALTHGETTLPNIEKVFLDARVDIDPDGNWALVENGTPTAIQWNSEINGNPIIYVSAYAMQTEGFATVNEAYAAYQSQWGDNGSEYEEPIPADATIVKTPEEFVAAMKVNGSKIYLDADIIVHAEDATVWGQHMFLANGKTVSVNLNGYDIVIEEDASHIGSVFSVANGGQITIEGDGNITVKNGKAFMGWTVNGRTDNIINVYGGTYSGNAHESDYALFYVQDTTGKINVYGGKFLYPVADNNNWGFNVHNSVGTQVVIEINEGALLQHETFQWGDGARIQLAEGCTLQEVTIDGETWYQVVKQ